MATQPDLLQTAPEPTTSLAFGKGLRVPGEVFASMALLRYQADMGEAFVDNPRPEHAVVHRQPARDAVIVTLMAPKSGRSNARVCQYRIGLSGDIVPALYPWIQSQNERLRYQADFISSYRVQQGANGFTAQVLCKVMVGQQLEYVWRDWVVADDNGTLHEYHDGAPVTLGQIAKFATVMHAMDNKAVKQSASVWHQPLSCAQLPAFRSLPYSTPLLEFQRGYLAAGQPRLTLERFSRSFEGKMASSLIRL